MLNITYKDRETNIWVRERTKVIDIINTVRKIKWSWAGHINRLKDDRWTSRITTWRPYLLLLNLRSPSDCGSCRRAVVPSCRRAVRACGTSLVRWMALQCAKHTARRLVIRKDDNGDQPSGGETTWTNTGATRYGRGQHNTG